MGNNSNVQITISWCKTEKEAQDAVSFFIANKTDDYISHSEIQCGRATEDKRWNENLNSILLEEFDNLRFWQTETADSRGLVLCYIEQQLAATAVVSRQINSSNIHYATLEDIIVNQTMQRKNIGKTVLDWIYRELKLAGVTSLFIESSTNNTGAQKFFANSGFEKVSVVMKLEIK